MSKDKIVNLVAFVLVGVVGGVILIIISELIKFSHVNFAPLGGYSWALWSYAVFLSVSFGIASKVFKVGNPLFILIAVTFIITVILYFLTYGLIFVNPIPFGVNAGPVL